MFSSIPNSSANEASHACMKQVLDNIQTWTDKWHKRVRQWPSQLKECLIFYPLYSIALILLYNSPWKGLIRWLEWIRYINNVASRAEETEWLVRFTWEEHEGILSTWTSNNFQDAQVGLSALLNYYYINHHKHLFFPLLVCSDCSMCHLQYVL